MEVTEKGLRAEAAELEAQCPGWHLWVSDDDQTLYATHVLTSAEIAAAMRVSRPGDLIENAVTLTPHSIVTARQEIAEWEHKASAGLAA